MTVRALSARERFIPTPFLKAIAIGAPLVFAGVTGADAAQSVFLKYPNITGTATVVGHAGEIVLTGFSANASTTATLGGASSGAGAGKVVCGQITITKAIDQTSPQFLSAMFSNSMAPTATITFESTANAGRGGVVYDYYKVDLANVIVTSVQQSDPQDTGITETIVLQAQRFRYTYNPRPGAPVSFAFDCVTNTAS